ncbi:MAG: hypothetical protein ACPHQD_16350 [Vibrio toranzoniae]|uniref:hypothetical protein n=1 Tax=Vibrio toranzoniae TaxID=1194427 RepID=UPI003C323AC3
MSRDLILPYFAVPPQQYDQQYFANLTRSFATYMQQQQNPGEERATNLTLTNLQTDDSGLEVGALFQQDGFVKIARTNVPHVRGSSGTGAVGSVTVTTT